MNMHFKRTQITRSRLIGLLVILGVAVLYLTAQPASLHAADYDGEFDISQNVLDIGVGGTYRVYDSVGTPTGNHITVTASDPVILYLDGVRITSPDAPPIDLNNGADVTIILMNDAMNTLTAGAEGFAGIRVSTDASVTITDDSLLEGRLFVNGGGGAAGIGGNINEDCGKVTINSGLVYAITTGGAAIGGGAYGSAGVIVINGGKVTAETSSFYDGSTTLYSAGIGSGHMGYGGNITINGGNVTAYGCSWAAGIGGGFGESNVYSPDYQWRGASGTITINDGYVEANGGIPGGAGIGSGRFGIPELITIKGGEVRATGGTDAAGIGGGYGGGYIGQEGKVVIEGGLVYATGVGGGAGIGGGYNRNGCETTISGGEVYATAGNNNAAGIGGGNGGGGGNIGGHGGTVTITGGYVEATGSAGNSVTGIGGGAGIGGGYHFSELDDADGGDGGVITISGGEVIARGGAGAAGIGGGYSLLGSHGGVITISGYADVTAYAGAGGAAIGGGRGAAGGTITISGGTIKAVGNAGDSGGSIRPSGGAGIGSGAYYDGHYGSGGNITISGGSIEAEGLVGGAGIGGGNGCDSGSIQISGNAVIVAKGHEGGAGIGGGNDGNSESITITGGTIRAQGGANAAGIGGGNGSGDDSSGGGSGGSGGSSGGSGSGGSITIGGSSEVIAIAGVRGAGIGGGNNGAAAIVVLEAPAKVIAYASDPDYNPAISAANYTNLGGSGLVNVAFYAGYNPTLSLAVVTITQADGTELLLVPPINYRCLAYTSVSGVNLLTTISSSVTQAFVYDGNDPETGSVSILSSTALMPVRGVTLATALTISFNTDTSSSLPDSICVAGSTVTLPTGAGLSKPGYTLDKWGTSPSGGTLFDPGQVVAVDSLLFGDDNRLMLYGLWRMNTIYRVTYDGNGATSGEVPIDLNDSYSPGDLVTVLGEGSLIRAGYTFAGWALNASGAIVYQTGDQFEISRDMVLFAVWSQIDDPTGPTKRPTSPVTPATGDWSPLVLPLLVLGSVMLGVGLALRRKNRRLVD